MFETQTENRSDPLPKVIEVDSIAFYSINFVSFELKHSPKF